MICKYKQKQLKIHACVYYNKTTMQTRLLALLWGALGLRVRALAIRESLTLPPLKGLLWWWRWSLSLSFFSHRRAIRFEFFILSLLSWVYYDIEVWAWASDNRARKFQGRWLSLQIAKPLNGRVESALISF